MDAVGRCVQTSDGRRGQIVQWAPFTGQLCDALVRFEDESECWFAMHMLKPAPGDLLEAIPLPDLREVRKERREQTKRQLQSILAGHINDFHKPWPGAEHGKAIIGRALVAALDEVS